MDSPALFREMSIDFTPFENLGATVRINPEDANGDMLPD
jgi:hypothetical protein